MDILAQVFLDMFSFLLGKNLEVEVTGLLKFSLVVDGDSTIALKTLCLYLHLPSFLSFLLHSSSPDYLLSLFSV